MSKSPALVADCDARNDPLDLPVSTGLHEKVGRLKRASSSGDLESVVDDDLSLPDFGTVHMCRFVSQMAMLFGIAALASMAIYFLLFSAYQYIYHGPANGPDTLASSSSSSSTKSSSSSAWPFPGAAADVPPGYFECRVVDAINGSLTRSLASSDAFSLCPNGTYCVLRSLTADGPIRPELASNPGCCPVVTNRTVLAPEDGMLGEPYQACIHPDAPFSDLMGCCPPNWTCCYRRVHAQVHLNGCAPPGGDCCIDRTCQSGHSCCPVSMKRGRCCPGDACRHYAENQTLVDMGLQNLRSAAFHVSTPYRGHRVSHGEQGCRNFTVPDDGYRCGRTSCLNSSSCYGFVAVNVSAQYGSALTAEPTGPMHPDTHTDEELINQGQICCENGTTPCRHLGGWANDTMAGVPTNASHLAGALTGSRIRMSHCHRPGVDICCGLGVCRGEEMKCCHIPLPPTNFTGAEGGFDGDRLAFGDIESIRYADRELCCPHETFCCADYSTRFRRLFPFCGRDANCTTDAFRSTGSQVPRTLAWDAFYTEQSGWIDPTEFPEGCNSIFDGQEDVDDDDDE